MVVRWSGRFNSLGYRATADNSIMSVTTVTPDSIWISGVFFQQYLSVPVNWSLGLLILAFICWNTWQTTSVRWLHPPKHPLPLSALCLCSVVESINHLVRPNDFLWSDRLSFLTEANVCVTFYWHSWVETNKVVQEYCLKNRTQPTVKC